MKKILFYFLFFPIFLSAQINESDTLKVKANLSLTGFWQGGNVETLIFRAKSDLSLKLHEKWVFKTKNSYVYQEFGKDKSFWYTEKWQSSDRNFFKCGST